MFVRGKKARKAAQKSAKECSRKHACDPSAGATPGVAGTSRVVRGCAPRAGALSHQFGAKFSAVPLQAVDQHAIGGIQFRNITFYAEFDVAAVLRVIDAR